MSEASASGRRRRAGRRRLLTQQVPPERADDEAAGDLHDRHRQPEEFEDVGADEYRAEQQHERVQRDACRERLAQLRRAVGGHRQEHRRAAEGIDDRQQRGKDQQDSFDDLAQLSAHRGSRSLIVMAWAGARLRYTTTASARPRVTNRAGACFASATAPRPHDRHPHAPRFPRGGRAPAPAAGIGARGLRGRRTQRRAGARAAGAGEGGGMRGPQRR